MQRFVVVLGAGESGMGAAYLAQKKGEKVFLSDAGRIAPEHKAELEAWGVSYEEGGHTFERMKGASLVVKSPGIPDTATVVQALRYTGIPVISEIEFAASYAPDAKWFCITGSNGKTTTTNLVYELLRAAHLDVAMAGNVGRSLARIVADEHHDYYVLELSSFQLDGMYQFRADVAILLNITPDHLDRYDHDMRNYVRSKFRICQNQTEGECFIFNADDEEIMGYMREHPVRAALYPFSKHAGKNVLGRDVTPLHPQESLSLKGVHNQYNATAAMLAALLAKVSEETIAEVLRSFQGIEHRLEFVREVEGVRYINDSKATNVDAVWYALESMKTPVVWIAGGTDKGNDYAPLQDFVREKVHTLICLGVENQKLIRDFGGLVKNVVEVHSAQEAVAQARHFAHNGDTVLLSPACASFDLFKNYEDRGCQFKEAVLAL